MCEFYYDPRSRKVQCGLNLIPKTCVLPHHDTFGKNWASNLRLLLSAAILLGIDERTGMLSDGSNWQVLGAGAVTLYRGGQTDVYKAGEAFSL